MSGMFLGYLSSGPIEETPKGVSDFMCITDAYKEKRKSVTAIWKTYLGEVKAKIISIISPRRPEEFNNKD